MTDEGLDDLFALQVPNVDHVILAPAHDPLATSDGEATEAAVLVVLVAHVRFQALAHVVVPQAYRVVQRTSQYIFAIR